MENYIKDNALLNNLSTNFKSINKHSQILKYIMDSPFTIFYGPTRSGKTYALKLVIKEATGSIIYIRSSPVRFNTKEEKRPVYNKPTDMKTITEVEKLIKYRRNLIIKGDGEKLNWITVIFDDIQSLDKTINLAYQTLMTKLAFSGRHYKIRTICLVQSYMKLDKSIRSQAASFFCLLPVSDSYRQQIYRDYFRIFDSEKDFIKLENLPKHSFLFKFDNKERFYYIKN